MFPSAFGLWIVIFLIGMVNHKDTAYPTFPQFICSCDLNHDGFHDMISIRNVYTKGTMMILNRVARLFPAFLLLSIYITGHPFSCDASEIRKGICVADFLAPLTETEKANVIHEWETQKPVCVDGKIEAQENDENGSRTYVISHIVNTCRHYGVVLAPPVVPDKKYPLLIINHGGTGGVSIPKVDLDDMIVLAPSFRGESLNAGELGTFQSEGNGAHYEVDAVDSLAFLDTVLQLIPDADSNCIIATGGSRGGSTTYRMAERSSQIKGIIVYFGVTDFFTDYYRNHVSAVLQDESKPDFLTRFLMNDMILPLKNEKKTLAEARHSLAMWSSLHYAERLPEYVMIHHGAEDKVVPLAHSERMIDRLKALGFTSPSFQYYIYEGKGHTRFPEAKERDKRFIEMIIKRYGS